LKESKGTLKEKTRKINKKIRTIEGYLKERQRKNKGHKGKLKEK